MKRFNILYRNALYTHTLFRYAILIRPVHNMYFINKESFQIIYKLCKIKKTIEDSLK